MPTHPFNPNRLKQLEELLDIQYERLHGLERAILLAAGEDQKIALRQQIKRDLTPNLRKLEREYAQLLATGVETERIPDDQAKNIVAELVEATNQARISAQGQAPPEMMRLLDEIKEKLDEPGERAAAKLKVSLPIIPLIASYELELDTNFVTRVWHNTRDFLARHIKRPPSISVSLEDEREESPLQTAESAKASTGAVFLSYSKADARSFAIEVCRFLESGSPPFSIWMEERTDAESEVWIGRHRDEEIDQAIRAAHTLLFVVSRDSIQRNSPCKREWTRALKYKKPIIPLRLHTDAEMPFGLEPREPIDFSGNVEPALGRLRMGLQWLASPAGVLQSLKDRLLDAQRDLRHAHDETGRKRIQAEIKQLEQQIAEQEKIVANPQAAELCVEKKIAQGLEKERSSAEPTASLSGRFINLSPGLAPSYFQDRCVETKLVGDFLKNDTMRLLRVVGRAGVGKTTMVCRVLNSLEDGSLPDGEPLTIDGIIYLSAAGSRQITLLALYSDLIQLLSEEVAKKLEGICKNPQATVQTKIEALLGAFPTGRTVVLLDNFENLIDPETQAIRDTELSEALCVLLRVPRHGIKLILTTRIAPRDLALVAPARQTPIELDKGLESPFAENILRSMDADGTVGLKDAPDNLLEEARERTLGFPRALEALFAILSIDRYTTLHEVLNDAAKLLPEEVIEVLVGDAFSRLDSVAQATMQALAVYDRPVTAAAVDYLLQSYLIGVNSARVLNRLVNAHLVRKEGDWYYLHPVDRAYAFGRLPQSQASDTGDMLSPPFTQLALLHRCAEYFRQARKPPELWKTIADVSSQLAEIDLRCQASEWDAAALVLVEIDYKLDVWGYYAGKAKYYERLLDRLGDAGLKAMCQELLGFVFFRLGEYERAITSLQDARTGAQAVENSWIEADALQNMAACYGDMGRTDAAVEHYRQALHMFTKIGNREGEGVCLNNVGFYLADLGQAALALDCHRQSLGISLDLGAREGASIDRANLGARLTELGDTDEAINCCRLALNNARAIGYRYAESVCLAYLGDCFSDKEDWNNALGRYGEARAIAAEIGNPQFEIHALIGLAEAHLFSGGLPQARELIDEARKYRVPRSSYKVMVLRGVIALRQNDRETAHESFSAALEQSETIVQYTQSHAKALASKGLALCGLALCGGEKNFDAAIEAFRAACAWSQAPGNIKRVLRRFDMLASSRDTETIPATVRLALVGDTTRNGK